MSISNINIFPVKFPKTSIAYCTTKVCNISSPLICKDHTDICIVNVVMYWLKVFQNDSFNRKIVSYLNLCWMFKNGTFAFARSDGQWLWSQSCIIIFVRGSSEWLLMVLTLLYFFIIIFFFTRMRYNHFFFFFFFFFLYLHRMWKWFKCLGMNILLTLL